MRIMDLSATSSAHPCGNTLFYHGVLGPKALQMPPMAETRDAVAALDSFVSKDKDTKEVSDKLTSVYPDRR